jgi:hypothetical protein
MPSKNFKAAPFRLADLGRGALSILDAPEVVVHLN